MEDIQKDKSKDNHDFRKRFVAIEKLPWKMFTSIYQI